MTNNDEIYTKLKFLGDVAQKELKHLWFSHQQVFSEPFTTARAETLLTDEFLAEKVEAFSSRFCRLQDTIGDKLLSAWLLSAGELPKTAVDNVMKAEKLGLLSSSMVHEYIESMDVLADALNRAHEYESQLKLFANALLKNLCVKGYAN